MRIPVFAMFLWLALSLVGCPLQQQAAVVPVATATTSPPSTPTLAAVLDDTIVVSPGERFVVEVIGKDLVYTVSWETRYNPFGLYGGNTRTEPCEEGWDVFSIDLSGGSYVCGEGILFVKEVGGRFKITPNSTLGVSVRPN